MYCPVYAEHCSLIRASEITADQRLGEPGLINQSGLVTLPRTHRCSPFIPGPTENRGS